MPSSRLTPDGRCVVTTPCSWASAGYQFRIVGTSSTWGTSYSDWVLRLLQPQPPRVRRVNEVDVRLAEEALLEQLRSRELHPALVEEPQAA